MENVVKPKIFILTALSSLLVVAAVSVTAQNLVLSTCAFTLYPELCASTIHAAAPADELMTALNYTISTVQRNYFTVKKIISARRSHLVPPVKGALEDCLEMIDDTLEELRDSEMELKDYGFKNYSIADHKEKLMTLLSAAQTNQESCLDGFSHGNADKVVRQALVPGQRHVFKLVSNVLAIIKNLADIEMAGKSSSSSSPVPEQGWPEWLSAGDRRLLQSTTVTPDVTVAADGSGDYRTIAEALAAAPERRNANQRYVIRIKAGVYRENVEIPRRKTNLMFVGDGRKNTIITASRNVVDGDTTFSSATFAVRGDGFLARDITFENAAGPSKDEAVALRVNADLIAFYRCGMIAYQGTLYVHSLRQFYTNCYIAGTVDFIFGNAAAVLQDCAIRVRRPNPGQKNTITAQGRDDPNQYTGIVIQRCSIGATSDLKPVQKKFPTYLGRPSKEYSRTIVMQTVISNVIHPTGWFEWDGNFALDTLFYAEYKNIGAGAATWKRVTWKGFRVLKSAAEAQPFTTGRFIAGGSWLAATGFPFSLGL